MANDLLKVKFDRIALPRDPRAVLVRLSDENRGIRIAVAPAAGGELASLQVRLNGRWREILHRALDYRTPPPDGWQGRAPTLWPAVGCSFTPEQVERWRRTGRLPVRTRYVTGGRERAMPGHGFAMRMPWQIDGIGYGNNDAWVTCTLASTPQTRKAYPFDFTVDITHSLFDGALVIRYDVAAGADNPGPMPFCLGNHISLRFPFSGRGRFQDGLLRTSATRKLLLSPLNILSGRTEPVDLAGGVSLAQREYHNLVLGGLRRGKAWMELEEPGVLTARITHGEIVAPRQRPLAAARNLLFVLWANPDCGYFCPEPWIGRPNGLNDPSARIDLPPGRRFTWEMRVNLQR